jgi:methyl-accepting chemotaxis protein
MHWFSRLEVRTQFLIIGVIILPFLVGLSSAGMWGVLQINRNLQDTQSNQIPSIYNLGKVSDKIQEVRLAQRDIMITNDTTQIQGMVNNIRNNLDSAQKYWNNFLTLPSIPSEASSISEFEVQYKNWLNEVEEFLSIAAQHTAEAATRKVELVNTPASRQLFNLVTNLSSINYQETDELSKVGQDTLNGVLLVLGSCAAGVIVVILVAGLVLARSILTLTNSQNRLNRELKQVFASIEDKRKLGEETSTRLKTVTSELNATSSQQASRSQEQAAALIEVTSNLSEFSETARQISFNARQVTATSHEGLVLAQEVREIATLANKTAERGQQAVNNSVHSIEEVGNGISVLSERLMKLTERSRKISQIINLIKGIADQTHLLALNAVIEAAGAGEAGQRFSVVADEVKRLADRSLHATGEVAGVINELQEAVAAAVLVSEETRQKTFGAVELSYQAGQVINELEQVVDKTAESTTKIVVSVGQITTLTEEISLATQQQDSVVRQINQTMHNLGIVAQENATAVAQVSATVGQIDQISTLLKSTLDSDERLPVTA